MAKDPHDFMNHTYLLQQMCANVQNKFQLNNTISPFKYARIKQNTQLSLREKEYIFDLARK